MSLQDNEVMYPDDMKILQNWLAMNQRMANMINEQEKARQLESKDNVRVANLKAVWDKFFEG